MSADERTEDLIDQAIKAQKKQDFEQAANLYVRAAALDPKDWRLPWEAGTLFTYHLKNPSRGIECFTLAHPLIKEDMKTADCLYNIGFSYAAMGDDTNAGKYFKQALDCCPVHILSSLEMGRLLMRARRYEEAKKMLQEAQTTNAVWSCPVSVDT